MKIAIIGSRSFNDYDKLVDIIYRYFSHLGEEHNDNGPYPARVLHFDKIISGGASGADKNSERFAKENNIPIEVIKPDYEKYGKGAPLVRNEEIIKKADTVLAFWDKTSKGTQNALNHAKKHNKDTIIIYFDPTSLSPL